jgi:HSP20 family molecular chaperone IbpA
LIVNQKVYKEVCIHYVYTGENKMFGDDFFDRIARDFFGDDVRGVPVQRGKRNSVSKNKDCYISNFNADYDIVDSGDNSYVILNLLDNLKKSDLVLEVEDSFGDEDDEDKGWFSKEKVLSIRNKNKKNCFLKIKIPKKFAKKRFSYTLNNGILEVKF